jgi:hypothetical protein
MPDSRGFSRSLSNLVEMAFGGTSHARPGIAPRPHPPAAAAHSTAGLGIAADVGSSGRRCREPDRRPDAALQHLFFQEKGLFSSLPAQCRNGLTTLSICHSMRPWHEA